MRGVVQTPSVAIAQYLKLYYNKYHIKNVTILLENLLQSQEVMVYYLSKNRAKRKHAMLKTV